MTMLLCGIISLNVYSQEKDTSFSLCEDVSTWPYYHPELKHKGGFWVIKEHFKSSYPTTKMQVFKKNSGIITVRFKVNCKGETGEFSLIQYDLDYQKTTLNKIITDYFLTKTKELKDWIPPKNEEGKIVNSHKFFSFRLINGELIEILPK
ncbi:MAG: hypothetical protein COB15_12505 [Flavobacteriales bacterium]|nr:MAG: hypothetical protein COB15_12505 [Flavobacteriales bacterium]